MKLNRRIAHSVVSSVAACLVLGMPLRGQSAPPATPQLSTAIVRGAAHWARNVLKRGGPLLIDSAALRKAIPAESPDAIARAYGRSVRLVSPAEAITCVSGTLRCTIKENGALVSIHSVRATADAAVVNATLRSAVESARRGSTVERADFEMQLERGPNGWAVTKFQGKGES
jgi:hypothetical protein